MNLALVNLITLALAAVSGSHAADKPYVLRGSAESEDVLIELESSDCDDGLKIGQSSMRQRWRKEGNNCDNAWNVDSMSRSVKRKYPQNGRNWRETTRNKCAQMGVDKEVARIKKACFEDDPTECLELGEAAAAQIVLSDVCDMAERWQHANDYEKSCRKMAYTVCKGEIPTMITKYCRNKMPSTRRINKIAKECPRKVDSLIGRNIGKSCPDDDEPSAKRDGDEYKFKQKGDKDERCTDDDDEEYSYGMYKDVKDSSKCAEKCVEDVKKGLLEDAFQGFDYDCKEGKCYCLYNKGSPNKRDGEKSNFDDVNRDKDGDGKIKNTKDKDDFICMRLEEVNRLFADDTEESGTKQYS